MKKLFFLIVSMVVIGGVSAQVTKTIKSVTSEVVSTPALQKVEKEPTVYTGGIPSYLNHSIMENVPMFSAKKPQKANYTYFDEVYSTEYAYHIVGEDGAFWTAKNNNRRSYMLFPDSLGIYYVYHTDNPAGSFNQLTVPGIGFNFDPYSKAFDASFQDRLLQYPDGVCGYRIDTLIVLGEYLVAKYDNNRPDTLRISLSYYNIYGYPNGGDDPMRGVEYFNLGWKEGPNAGMRVIPPVLKFEDRNNIAAKGPVTMPVSATTKTVNYVLSLKDSVDPDGNYLRYIRIPTDFQVPVGSITSVVIKYVPGYDYNNGDTIRRIDYNTSTQTIVSETNLKNVFTMGIINDTNFAHFLDATSAYNGRFMEDQDVRYDVDKDYLTGADWNPNHLPVYNFYWYAIPYASMKISVDDERWDLSVKDPNPIVSKIYPNPANNQVKIELINDETAELSIVNMLGQVVNVATLNEMDNTVDVSSLSSGIYMLKISQGGNVYTTKFIKR